MSDSVVFFSSRPVLCAPWVFVCACVCVCVRVYNLNIMRFSRMFRFVILSVCIFPIHLSARDLHGELIFICFNRYYFDSVPFTLFILRTFSNIFFSLNEHDSI